MRVLACIYVFVCMYVCCVLMCMYACVSQKKEVKPRKSNDGVAAAKQPVIEGETCACVSVDVYVSACPYVMCPCE